MKQHGLFCNTPECDAPFQSAGVAGSTVIQQHLRLSLGMICNKIPVSFLFRGMTRTAKQAEFRRNSGPLRLVFVFREITFLLEIGNPSFGRWMYLISQNRAYDRTKLFA